MTCEKAMPSDARQTTPAARKIASSSQSFGHPIPKNSRPATMTIASWTTAFVTALPKIPPRYAALGNGVPRMRLRTPCSRRNTRLCASALKVVDMTARPAMPGTMTSRFSWLPLKIAPNSARKSSGRKKLKNAAAGLRQNRRRSRRYWRQARPTASATGALRLLGVGGQLEVDVLERRARDREVAQRGAARQGAARELVQQRRG